MMDKAPVLTDEQIPRMSLYAMSDVNVRELLEFARDFYHDHYTKELKDAVDLAFMQGKEENRLIKTEDGLVDDSVIIKMVAQWRAEHSNKLIDFTNHQKIIKQAQATITRKDTIKEIREVIKNRLIANLKVDGDGKYRCESYYLGEFWKWWASLETKEEMG